MTIATALILNVIAVIGLLGLLAATMRLPYHLPTSPRSGAAETPESQPKRKPRSARQGSRQERGAPEPVYSR